MYTDIVGTSAYWLGQFSPLFSRLFFGIVKELTRWEPSAHNTSSERARAFSTGILRVRESSVLWLLPREVTEDSRELGIPFSAHMAGVRSGKDLSTDSVIAHVLRKTTLHSFTCASFDRCLSLISSNKLAIFSRHVASRSSKEVIPLPTDLCGCSAGESRFLRRKPPPQTRGFEFKWFPGKCSRIITRARVVYGTVQLVKHPCSGCYHHRHSKRP